MDIADQLCALGYGPRGARIQRCPPKWDPTTLPCGDRLCRRCGRRWVRRHLERLCLRVADIGAPVMIWATLKTTRSSARSACELHREAFARFARVARQRQWSVVGARHLTRGTSGAWNRHDHLLILGHGDRAVLAAAVAAAGASWVSPAPIRSVGAVIRYAVTGSLEPPTTGVADWIEATRGARMIIAIGLRARDTDKRKISTVTPKSPTQVGVRIQARVLAALERGPVAASTIRKQLTPADRGTLPAILAAMLDAGELERVPWVRGVRWARVASRGCGREAVSHG